MTTMMTRFRIKTKAKKPISKENNVSPLKNRRRLNRKCSKTLKRNMPKTKPPKWLRLKRGRKNMKLPSSKSRKKRKKLWLESSEQSKRGRLELKLSAKPNKKGMPFKKLNLEERKRGKPEKQPCKRQNESKRKEKERSEKLLRSLLQSKILMG